jgi:uncharacterized protein YecT (DUF1311 family)
MCKKNIIFSMGSLFLLGNSLCLDVSAAEEHSIEKWTTECVKKDSFTNCHLKAYDKWDKELNRVYKALMSKLRNNKQAQNDLRKAQIAWLNYKKAEEKVSASIYTIIEGTAKSELQIYSDVDVIKQRSFMLIDYLEELESAEED